MSQENENDDDLFLNQPDTVKHIESGENFVFGGIRGWRRSNEDFHKHLVPIDQHPWKLWNYFAIFDGHNGSDAAKYASELLHTNLLEAFNEIIKKYSNEQIHSSQLDNYQLNQIIKHTFFQLDRQLANLLNDQSGSVCIATLIGPEHIYLINLGDSRAIIVSDEGQVLESTKDHKPSVGKERERICRAGGHVTQYGDDVPRVENYLAVSRALGDYSIDKHFIPPSPDIIQYSKQSSISFIVLACDGVWDVMSNEDVALFIHQRLTNHSLTDIVQQLLDHCLQLQSTDNISIYIIKI